MRTPIRGILATISAAAVVALIGCHSGGNTAATPAGPTKKNVGGIVQADPTNGKFVVSGTRGTYTVEMAGSAITRDGHAAKPADLKEGQLVVINGMVDGQTLKATKINIIHDKGQLPDKPVKANGSPSG